jgi:hypothetical protein
MKRFSPVLALLLTAPPALATTIVMGTDEELFDQAELIAEATVLAAAPSADRPATEYRVRVERAIKGLPPGGELVVRVPGGAGEKGLRLVVWGAPSLHPGERALLFLSRYPEGDFGPLHLGMGAFHEVRDGGRRLAVRDLSGMEDLSQGKAAPARDEARDFGRFGGWLADRAAGLRRPQDYFVEAPASALRPIPGKFTNLQNIEQRWIEFDQGASIGWRAQKSGQPGLAGGGFAQFKTAIQTWNGDAATNIRYTYNGTTSKKGGLSVFDGVNAIIFDDPNREVNGTFICSSPGNGFGVLALGGTWIVPTAPEPIRIQGGDIVINDGAGCWFSTGKRAEQVYGHELGHTLGLGHSCGDPFSGPCVTPEADDALMRATAHADERGATLKADDRAGILSLYADSTSKPAAPTDLTVTVLLANAVRLDWVDKSSNETGFRLERSTPATGWTLLATVPAGTQSFTTAVSPDTPTSFRVRANGGTGNSAFSNAASITVLSTIPGPCVAGPENLCLLGGRFRVAVRWRTTSPTFPMGAGIAVPDSDQTGLFWFFDDANVELIVKMFDGRPLTPTFWAFYGGLSDVEYWIVITDTETGESKTYHNEPGNLCGLGDVSAFPAPSSSAPKSFAASPPPRPVTGSLCAPGTLCLSGGRFQVEVTWKTGDDEAAGTPVPFTGTDESGLFWFFSEDNKELVVKIVDGRSVNGKFWFFYGALSDVEYQIRVTDTANEATKVYNNPRGNLCGKGDTEAFDG